MRVLCYLLEWLVDIFCLFQCCLAWFFFFFFFFRYLLFYSNDPHPTSRFTAGDEEAVVSITGTAHTPAVSITRFAPCYGDLHGWGLLVWLTRFAPCYGDLHAWGLLVWILLLFYYSFLLFLFIILFLSPTPFHDGIWGCRSDWPGLWLFCCYQRLFLFSANRVDFGLFFFHTISNFTPPPWPCRPVLDFGRVAKDRASTASLKISSSCLADVPIRIGFSQDCPEWSAEVGGSLLSFSVMLRVFFLLLLHNCSWGYQPLSCTLLTQDGIFTVPSRVNVSIDISCKLSENQPSSRLDLICYFRMNYLCEQQNT